MNLCDIHDIKPLLARYGFKFSKSMGQNFLINASVPYNIAYESGADEQSVILEIGPGIGCLTAQLAKRAKKVVAIELDKALLPVLQETLSEYDNVTVINDDFMKIDLNKLKSEYFGDLTPRVCANLPYNITSPVLTKLLESGIFASITVMIQKEVAQRICATPSNKDYGSFSILCQYYSDCEMLFDVSPDNFIPAPKVTSTVIRMNLRNNPPANISNEKLFFKVVKAAFLQRRKKLSNGLYASFKDKITKDNIAIALNKAGLTENIRGEQLSIADFANLTEEISKLL